MHLITRLKQFARPWLKPGQAAGSTAVDFPLPQLTAAEIAEIKTFFPLSKFFVFGHARSGTTLLMRLMRVHPQVHCSYQAHFFSRPPLLRSLVATPEIQEWLGRPSNRWNRGANLSPVIPRVVADFVMEREARTQGKQIVGDKSPNNLLNGRAVHLMHEVYPDAKLIYIVRDVRDVVISHRIQQFVDGEKHLNQIDRQIRQELFAHPELYLRGKKSMFTPGDLVARVETWRQNVQETHHAAQHLYSGQYLSLRFEDMHSHPLQEMMRVWDFLGADIALSELSDLVAQEMASNIDADYQLSKLGKLAEFLPKGRPQAWRDILTPEDIQVIERIGGSELEAWQYPLA